jgi:hypothetical protein
MPAAALAIPAAIGAAGSTASSMGGKKASNNLAKQQLALQQAQFGLTKQQFGLGNAALGPATSFWQDLLKGGPAAQQATGPYASLISQQGAGTANAIRGSTARGGEQNLALAQNQLNTGGNIARLYAGMQPAAAQGLTNIGGAYFGSGSALNPTANIGAGMQSYLQQQQMAQQGAAGFGGLLYQALRKQGGSGAAPAPTSGGKT